MKSIYKIKKKSNMRNIFFQKDKCKQRISFADGMNFYKIFLIFVTCSVVGYLIEVVWCYFYHGFFESRKSLLFGPFSVVYGFGAILIVLVFKGKRKKSMGSLFWTAAFLGTIFEYMVSCIQELVFGTVSWDYGDKFYSLGGRANLLFSLGWGIIAVCFIKYVVPFLNSLIGKIPNNFGLAATWVLILFISTDMFLSATAVLRQMERREGIEAKGQFELFLDKSFPDEYLNKVYVNMRVAGTTLMRDTDGKVIK